LAPRLVAFGGFAGQAGMINGLRGLGLRLLSLGYSTPLVSVGPAHSYASYELACRALREVGAEIRANGLPAASSPMVVAICGRGSVSNGAADTLRALGDQTLEWVKPSELPALSRLHGSEGPHQKRVYACMVGTEDMVEHTDSSKSFQREHYLLNPDEYKPIFHERIAPHSTMVLTGMYWDRRYPRLLTVDQLREMNANGQSRLLEIADVTCDLDGAVETLVRTSSIDDPYYLYDLNTRAESTSGLEGDGIMMMGVDILPAELPREASTHFGNALLPFLDQLSAVEAVHKVSCPELEAATIASHGKLKPAFEYISSMRQVRDRAESQTWSRDEGKHEDCAETDAHRRPSTVSSSSTALLSLQGHLFDSGLINAALDKADEKGCAFEVVELDVKGNRPGANEHLSKRTKTRALLRLHSQDATLVEAVISEIETLPARMPLAQAEVLRLEGLQRQLLDRVPDRSQLKSSSKLTASSSLASMASGQTEQRVLFVLGAGMCSLPSVEYLSRAEACGAKSTHVVLVSGIPGEAEHVRELLMEQFPDRSNISTICADLSAGSVAWDPTDGVVGSRLHQAAGCLSLLPASLHAAAAEACVKSETPLCTASYPTEELLAWQEEAAKRNVPILVEMGLDPGLDHMSACALLDQYKGFSVKGFSSICGGLPAPECAYSNGNPFGYKFSWSPMGVLHALHQPATYSFRHAGSGGESLLSHPDHLAHPPAQPVSIRRVGGGRELLQSAVPLDGKWGGLGAALQLEVLPNRNALPYAKMYGVADTSDVDEAKLSLPFFRGTIRYAGWCRQMESLLHVGLLDTEPWECSQMKSAKSWPQLLSEMGLLSSDGFAEPRRCSSRDDRLEENAASILRWLGAFEESALVEGSNPREATCSLLGKRLMYEDGERDAILMEHKLHLGGESEDLVVLSTLYMLGGGDKRTPSAMSHSVGVTAAIGLKLLVSDSGAALKGLVQPMDRLVREWCLPRLEEEGLRFAHSVHKLKPGEEP